MHPAAPSLSRSLGPRVVSPVIYIGAAHWNIVARAAMPLPRGADMPGQVTRAPGGVAQNVALALARHGVPAILLAAIGSDAEGDALAAAMAGAGVATEHLTRLPGATDRYVAIEDGGGDIVAAVADCGLLEQAAPVVWAALRDGRLAGPDAPWQGRVVLDGNLPEEVITTIGADPCLAEARLALIGASGAKAARLAAGLAHPRPTLYLNRHEAERLCTAAFPTSRAAALALREQGA
jgi:pseudouridine kinase